MNSPTTAPTTANVIATFSEAKIWGNGCGRWKYQKLLSGFAPIDRSRKIESRCTDCSPLNVSIIIGKKASKKDTSTFGRKPTPTHTTRSGPRATFGKTWMKISHG